MGVHVQTPKPLSAERLESLLQERGDMAARPRQTPREVLAKWMDNFGVGVGVGVAAGVGLWFAGAPDSLLWSAAPGAGLVAFGGMMAWRGSLDERSDWRNVRNVRRTVTAARQEFDSQVRTLRGQLDMAFDEIETLERSLDAVTQERNRLAHDLGRERQAAQAGGRVTYVPPVEVTPQELSDAAEMLRYRYSAGAHLSRRRAAEGKRWTQPRWEAAQTVLSDAGVIAVVSGQTQYPATLDEALQMLGAYMLHAHQLSAPAINKALASDVYVETDEG